MEGRKEGWKPGRIEEHKDGRKEGRKEGRKKERTEGRMEHWSHEQQDGGQARDEGVTEKIFALVMGLAAVRSWPQQTSQTDTHTVHGSGDEPKYLLFKLQKIYA